MWLSAWVLIGILVAFLAFGVNLYLEVYRVHDATVSYEPIELDSRVADTCRLVAAARALDSGRPSLFHNQDPLAMYLAGEEHMRCLAEEVKLLNVTALDLNPVTMRTIAIDERIMSAARDGVRQVVMIGAGMDTRPYRLVLPNVTWFEVDVPSVLSLKAELLGRVPEELQHLLYPKLQMHTIVPLNLEGTLRDALHYSGFDSTLPTYFIMEGLLMYLTVGEIKQLFQSLPVVEGSRATASVVLTLYRQSLQFPPLTYLLDVMAKSHRIASLWKSDWLSFTLARAYHPWRITRDVNIGEEFLHRGVHMHSVYIWGWRIHMNKSPENLIDFVPAASEG
jgi:methyltransferase (TIGR00027 family)